MSKNEKIKIRVTEPLIKGGDRYGFFINVSKEEFEKDPNKTYSVPNNSALVSQLLKTGLFKMANTSKASTDTSKKSSKNGGENDEKTT